MQKIKMSVTIVLTFLISAIFVSLFDDQQTRALAEPKTLYQVYLAGNPIGVTDSKIALEQYINQEQKAIKDQYKVEKVYPPKDLYIEKYINYTDKILSAKEIYDKIQKESPFTIKGYAITIKREDPITVYVLKKEMFSNAVTRTIQAFVPKEQFENFKNDTQKEVITTGKLIEDLYIEENITISESFIDVNKKIFIDEDELTKYLLFGTTSEQKKYTVKMGDSIEDVAFAHQLGVEEFMIVNPTLSNATSLLYVGQQVNIGLINPLFKVIVEEHVVSDEAIPFQTKYIDDPNTAYGVTFVKQEGSNGVTRVTQKIKRANGQILGVVFPKYEIITPAINKIVVRGSKFGGVDIPVYESGWKWPTRSPYIITSVFGYRWGRMHWGIDISGTGHGSPIYASKEGVVIQSRFASDYGHYIFIQHPNGYVTGYAHLSRRNFKVGDVVKQGDIIGAMGNTGVSTGTHLHFEVFSGTPFINGSRRLNPMLLFR